MHEDARQLLLRRQPQQRVQMPLMRVHAAIGQQPDQVQRAALLLRRSHRRQQRRVRKEAAVHDRRVDARHVHAHNAPRAKVQMPHLAVAHLPVRQPDKVVARPQQRVGKIAQQPVINRLARQCDRIAVRLRAEAPAVKNRQNNRFCHVSQNTKSRARNVRHHPPARAAPHATAPRMRAPP